MIKCLQTEITKSWTHGGKNSCATWNLVFQNLCIHSTYFWHHLKMRPQNTLFSKRKFTWSQCFKSFGQKQSKACGLLLDLLPQMAKELKHVGFGVFLKQRLTNKWLKWLSRSDWRFTTDGVCHQYLRLTSLDPKKLATNKYWSKHYSLIMRFRYSNIQILKQTTNHHQYVRKVFKTFVKSTSFPNVLNIWGYVDIIFTP